MGYNTRRIYLLIVLVAFLFGMVVCRWAFLFWEQWPL